MAVVITEFRFQPAGGGLPLHLLDLCAGLNVALVRDPVTRIQLLNVVPGTLYGDGPFFRDPLGTEAAVVSGTLLVRSDQGLFQVERRTGADTPIVSGPDGMNCPPGYLERLLEGTRRSTYREVFLLDAVRLARLARRSRRGIDRLIRTVGRLDAEYRSGAARRGTRWPSLAPIRTKLRALDGLVSQDAQARPRQSPSDHENLAKRLAELESEIANNRSELTSLRAQHDQTYGLMKLACAEDELSRVDQQIAERQAPDADRRPSEHPAAERLRQKVGHGRERYRQLLAEENELSERIESLGQPREPETLRQVEAVLFQEKAAATEEQAIEQLRQQRHELQSRIEAERGTRAPGSGVDMTLDQDASTRLEQLAESIAAAERQQEQAERDLEGLESTGTLSVAVSTAERDTVLRDAEEHVAELRRQLNAAEDLNRLQQEREQAQLDIDGICRRCRMPLRTAVAIGIPFVLGVTAVVYGTMFQQETINWQMVLAGLLVTAFAALVKMVIDRRTVGLLDAAQRRLNRIDERLQLATQEPVTRFSEEDLEDQLGRAEERLMDLRSLPNGAPGISAVEESADNLAAARARADEARDKLQEVMMQWHSFLESLGLPAAQNPSQAREALAHRAIAARCAAEAQLARQNAELDVLQAEIARRTEQLAKLAARVGDLLHDLGQAAGESLTDNFERLRQQLALDRQLSDERRAIARTLRRVRRDRTRVRNAARRYLRRCRRLAEEGRRASELRALEVQCNLQFLQKHRQRLQLQVDELRARHNLDATRTATENSDESLPAKLTAIERRMQALEEALLKQAHEQGQLEIQLRLARHPERHADDNAQLLRESVSDLSRALREWMQAARQCRDSDARPATQPAYLELAGRHLAGLSGGRFLRIQRSPADDEVLLVGRNMNAVPLHLIDPGYLASLYFSLWIARLELFADRGRRLPIVLEDPLETAVSGRKTTTARLLCELGARGHQLVLVTSTSKHAEMFGRLGVPIAELAPEPRPSRNTRRTRKRPKTQNRRSAL